MRGVVAEVGVLALADLVEDDRTLDAGVGRDLADRGAQGRGDHVRAGLLIAGELGSGSLCGLAGHDIRRAAAGHDALFDGCAGRVERVLDAQLLFLHFGLGRSADLDDRNTAGQLGQALLQLLLVVLGGRRLDLGVDLRDAGLDVVLGPGALDDGRGLLRDLDLTCVAELGQRGVLELHAEVGRDDLAAGQDGDILQHFLAAVAEAGGLDAHAGERAAQLVEDDGGQRLALDVVGDDNELLARVEHGLEHRQDLLNVRDLLVRDEDERVVNDGFHLVVIGDHIRSDIAAVELHTFDDLGIGLGGLALLDGDDAVLADLLHRLGDELADVLVTGRDRADTRDVAAAAHGLGVGADGFDGRLGRLLDAAAHDHRIRAGGEVLQTLADHRLRQHGGGGGAVARDVVGLGAHFADELRAHVLKRVLELDLFCDRHAVVRDQRSAELLAQHHVAALGAEGDLHGICKLIHAALQRLACFFTINNLFCHNDSLLMNQAVGCYSTTARMSP